MVSCILHSSMPSQGIVSSSIVLYKWEKATANGDTATPRSQSRSPCPFWTSTLFKRMWALSIVHTSKHRALLLLPYPLIFPHWWGWRGCGILNSTGQQIWKHNLFVFKQGPASWTTEWVFPCKFQHFQVAPWTKPSQDSEPWILKFIFFFFFQPALWLGLERDSISIMETQSRFQKGKVSCKP